MPIVDFSQYPYYPALRCSTGEHLGYRSLGNSDKDWIIPVLELSQRGNSPSLDPSIANIRQTIGARAFILDLCHEPAPDPHISANPRDPAAERQRVEQEREAQEAYNRGLARLLDPSDGFSAWRRLVTTFPNAIPVIQYTDADAQARQILRQAAFFSRTGSIAIRIRQEDNARIFEIISQIISVIDSPDHLLIIIDCGQGRQRLRDRANFARNAIGRITEGLDPAQIALIRAVCMSNTFMKPNHDGLIYYRNDDWGIWRAARESFPFLFGDYAAMNRIRRMTTFTPSDYRATVVYPLNDAWLVYRHPDANDEAGWGAGAEEVVAHERYQPVPEVWGAEVIGRAANGDTADVLASRFWHAVKVNIHIHRQIGAAAVNVAGLDGEDEGYDE
ncbi:hypothetical protein M2352_000729 [Azospirillum fermentarium]|uniref:beta family protein n=1 Tax=Azospirillum fermentarium TaxID=1233114 RepID=UPI002226D237|nr:beta family protein [Azospirillum fermentarium]MCW2245138.1 hypothetical protein [Azospirillum fermentarium]